MVLAETSLYNDDDDDDGYDDDDHDVVCRTAQGADININDTVSTKSEGPNREINHAQNEVRVK